MRNDNWSQFRDKEEERRARLAARLAGDDPFLMTGR